MCGCAQAQAKAAAAELKARKLQEKEAAKVEAKARRKAERLAAMQAYTGEWIFGSACWHSQVMKAAMLVHTGE
jgi:hypothetical protein